MKVFLIAIGGTGMRCLEAFTHLCAMGMCAGHEIEVLSLDTDIDNGNKNRAERVVDNYMKINDGTLASDGPFSAKINLYKFWPENINNKGNNSYNYKDIAHSSASLQDQYLSDLFFDERTQEFNLKDGYRAQTQIGSYLMYSSIVQEIKEISQGTKQPSNKEDDLYHFLERLRNTIGSTPEPTRIFLLGSVFGGTGASSIPVLPQALEQAIQVNNPGFNIGDDVVYGATLLTQYFTFGEPGVTAVKKEKVIASSSNFPFNTQAALRFYQQDPTVKKLYKRLYLLGWPEQAMSYQDNNGSTITGGLKQRNPSHVIELLSACAAYDFLFHPNINQDHQVLYRSVDDEQAGNFGFTFYDFFDAEKDQKKFKQKIGSLYALNHLIETKGGGSFKSFLNLLRNSNNVNSLKDYDLSQDINKAIDNYLHRFGLQMNNEKFERGWIHEVAQSNGGHFLFASEIYGDKESIKSFPLNKLYRDEDHQIKTGFNPFYGKTRKAFSRFVDCVQKTPDPGTSHNNNILKLLQHLELALTDYFKFSTSK